MLRYLLLIAILIPCSMVAQNLVRNPGFELKNGCPDKPGQIGLAASWYNPNNGTPDYFNDCSPGLEYGTEFNKKGGQLPHSGHAYAGLQFYYLNRNEFYEYIQTQLDTSLVRDRLYCISAYVSLGKVEYGMKELGAVMSSTEIKQAGTKKMKIPYTPLGNGQFLLDQSAWMCIRGLYRAKGGEKLLTIGDFSPGDGFWSIMTRMRTDSLFKSSYYFIDDVSVEAIGDSNQCRCLPAAAANRLN